MITKHSSIYYISILLLLVVISTFEGCIPSKQIEEVEVIPSERLVKRLEANRRKVKNFEGSGSLEITTKGFNGNVDFKTILLKPDSLYIEFYGPFGIDLAQVLITNKTYAFYDVMHNVLYQGHSGSDILKQVFKIDLSFNDLMDAFVGSVNLTPRLQQEPDNYEIAYSKYVLTYRDSLSGMSSRYRVDIRDLAITNFELLDQSQNTLVHGQYSKFRMLDNIPIPYNTEVSVSGTGQKIKIDYKRVQINKKNLRISMNVPDDVEVKGE